MNCNSTPNVIVIVFFCELEEIRGEIRNNSRNVGTNNSLLEGILGSEKQFERGLQQMNDIFIFLDEAKIRR